MAEKEWADITSERVPDGAYAGMSWAEAIRRRALDEIVYGNERPGERLKAIIAFEQHQSAVAVTLAHVVDMFSTACADIDMPDEWRIKLMARCHEMMAAGWLSRREDKNRR